MNDFSVSIITLSTIFLAGITHGLVGFGFSLVSVPLLVIFLSPKIVIPIILTLTIFTPIPIFLEAWRFLNIKRFIPLIISGIIGMPFGTYLLIGLDTYKLKIIIGVVAVIFALSFLIGFKKRLEHQIEKHAFIPIGFISGVLNGSISFSGPPVVLFFSNQEIRKQAFRVNLVAYFFILNIATFILYFVTGLIDRRILTYTFFLFPVMLTGVFIGVLFVHRVKEYIFRKIVLIIIMITGLIGIASGLKLL